MKNVIIDSNVFGTLFNNNTPDNFDKFELFLKSNLNDEVRFCSTPLGNMEKIGIQIPKLDLTLPDNVPDGDYDPRSAQKFGKKVCDTLSYIRLEAKSHYEKYISENILKERFEDQKNNYWKNSPKSNEWLLRILPIENQYKVIAHDLIELLPVDYQHGYAQFPKEMFAPALSMSIMAMLVEYLGVPPQNPRNVVLGRLFKKMWLDRIRSGDKVPEEEVEKFHSAMKYRNSEDFVDLEITYFTLLGYFIDGEYQSTYSITSDPVEKVKRRLFVVKEILNSLNNDIYKNLFEPPVQMRYTHGKIFVVDSELNLIETICP